MSHQSGHIIIDFVEKPLVGPIKRRDAIALVLGVLGGWLLL